MAVGGAIVGVVLTHTGCLTTALVGLCVSGCGAACAGAVGTCPLVTTEDTDDALAPRPVEMGPPPPAVVSSSTDTHAG